jgi:hypothetical protein
MMLSAVCLALLSEPQSPAVAKLNVVAGGGGGGGDERRSCFAYVNDVIVIAVIKALIVNKNAIIFLSSRGATIFVMGF